MRFSAPRAVGRNSGRVSANADFTRLTCTVLRIMARFHLIIKRGLMDLEAVVFRSRIV